MAELSRKAYEKVQKVAKLIFDEDEAQIKSQPIVLSNEQVGRIIPEDDFKDALEYLEERRLITFKHNTEYSADYYEYRRKREIMASFSREEAGEMWEQIQEKTIAFTEKMNEEKRKWHFTTFTITLQPAFSMEYRAIVTKYNYNIRYKMHLDRRGGSLLFINDLPIYRFNASWRQEIFKHALGQENGTTIDTNPYMPKTVVGKKIRGMPQILPEIVQSKYLRDVFFHDIHATKFKIYHTITDDMIKEGFCDTTLVDDELRQLSKKSR